MIAIIFVSLVGGLFQIMGWSTFVGSGHGDYVELFLQYWANMHVSF